MTYKSNRKNWIRKNKVSIWLGCIFYSIFQTCYFVYLISPTFKQKVWDRIKKNFEVISTIAEINDTINALIICDDDQLVVNGNKLLTQILLNERHRSTCIIQYEQYTQSTDLTQRMNSDCFILLEHFTLGDCSYFTKHFQAAYVLTFFT